MSFNSKIFVISGKARCGKSTLAKGMVRFLRELGISAKEYAFANELKREVDPLTLLNLGISAFTEVDAEKKIIRPLLQIWGTQVWRNLDADHWIKRVDEAINNESYPHVACVSDGRFPNELNWAKDRGGNIIHITRFQDNGEEFPPAGEDERINDPLLKNMADFKFSWNNYHDNLSDCYNTAEQFFNEIFAPQDILRWQQDFPIPT